MSLDYPILPICQTAESFRNILSAMGPYRDSISLKKSPLLGLYTGSEAQLDLATVRYHALGAYAKSVYLVLGHKASFDWILEEQVGKITFEPQFLFPCRVEWKTCGNITFCQDILCFNHIVQHLLENQ